MSSAPSFAPSSLKRTRATALLDQFTDFRSELDEHQARRERVIKTSRDITALSKKLIFNLHQVASGKSRAAVFKEAEGKMAELRTLFEKVSVEVKGEDFWRYERQISPGLQEYLEGFTFYYYLQHHSLPTLAHAQASLIPPAPAPPAAVSTSVDPSSAPSLDASSSTPSPSSDEPYVRVTVDDYLGGVADLTGELMRLAIASVGRNLSESIKEGARAAAGDGGDWSNIDYIGRVVREIKGEMDPLAVHCRWLSKKLQVLDQSLGKIENASYNLRIRGAEYKDSPAMLQALARKMAESSSGGREVETEA